MNKLLTALLCVVTVLVFAPGVFASSQTFSPTNCVGNFTSCSNAFANGGGSDATATHNQQSIYRNYAFTFPSNTSISQVQLIVDASEGSSGTKNLTLEVSSNNGSSYAAPHKIVTLPGSEARFHFDISGDASWSSSNIGQLTVRATCQATGGNCELDWLPVNVTFSQSCDVSETFDACSGTTNVVCNDYDNNQASCQAFGCTFTPIGSPVTSNNTVFSESFNSFTFWTAGTSWSENSQADIDGPVTNSSLTLTGVVNLSGYNNATAKAEILIDSDWDGGEFLCMDYSCNGGTSWNANNTALCIDGNVDAENVDHTVSIDVRTACGSMPSNFKLRFRATSNDNQEDGIVDNVVITGSQTTFTVTSDCSGSPSSCASYSNTASCDAAGCAVACRLKTYCGDGSIQTPNEHGISEACDDGNTNNNDGCSSTCALEVCGDGIQQSNEFCDDSNTANGDGCSSLCVVEFCGDSAINNNTETCDAGVNNGVSCGPAYGTSCLSCSGSCQVVNETGPYCGDGAINGAEQCDGINGTGPHQACTQSCQLVNLTYCGDGAVQQPNDELTGGPANDGIEACDGSDGTGPHQICSSSCTLIDLTYCGDGAIQATNDENVSESCDDAGQNGVACSPAYGLTCDYCSASCQSVHLIGPACGDANIDAADGETCDDGNTDPLDGCDAVCHVEYCGDGIDNNGSAEECDDGNAVDTDSCSNACTVMVCGDGIEQPTNDETCDDGNLDNNDGCSSVCLDEVCGDGIQQSNEFCDDSNTANGDGCSSACVVEFCGDYVVNNLTETCDSGAVNGIACSPGYGSSCQYCSGSCQPINLTGEFCGDLVVNGAEECDGTNGTGAHQICSQSCALVNLTYCGDGIHQPLNEENATEECDGVDNVGDHQACSASCVLSDLTYCGDGIHQPLNEENVTEQCDGSDNVGPHQACSASCVLQNLTWCGDSVVQDPNDDAQSEQCDVGAQNGVECVAGYGQSCQYCSDLCQFETSDGPQCGDANIDAADGETCDDGNTDPLDGCDAVCHVEYCGDGVDNNGSAEECDDGNAVDTDSCSNACTVMVCGDGIEQPTNDETCDDGNLNNNDGCSSVCLDEVCGDGIQQSNEFCDDSNTANGDGCSSLCVVEFCGDYVVNNLTETCDSGAVNGIACSPGYGESCQYCGSSCSNVTVVGAFCGDLILNGDEACDGSAPEHYACESNCTLTYVPYCGDGIVNQNTEECDDANLNDTDACSDSCTVNFCEDFEGNVSIWTPGLLNSSDGLKEDDCDGASSNLKEFFCDGFIQKHDNIKCSDFGAVCVSADGPDYCSCPEGTWFDGSACVVPVCGDGAINQQGETCDDGNTANNDGCSSVCVLEACGDGIAQISEECDDGNDVNTDSCTNVCTDDVCGDGFIQASNGETCDDSNAVSGDGCSSACVVEFCGDYVVNNLTETCDSGAVNGIACSPEYGSSCQYCSGSCQPINLTGEFCGDLVVNGAEECDGTNGTGAHQICSQSCALVDLTYCGDGVIQPTNDENVSESCDDGASNGQVCSPAYGGSCQYCDSACQPVTVDGSACGDGVVDDGETCDDNNTLSNDGCSSVCALEACGDGIQQISEECDDGNDVNTDSCTNVCTDDVCGDGFIQASNGETCDDGNTDSDDGCSSVCLLESCGDEIVQSGESCDEGAQNGVVCSPGYDASCGYCGSTCQSETVDGPYCGDQVLNGPEACDGADGVGDHQVCSTGCTLEELTYCGDGEVQSPNDEGGILEMCDDGNTDSGDGCDASCQEEAGVCGDGQLDDAEQCDDGNTDAADGCSATCQIEEPIPEFSQIAAGLAMAGAGAAYLMLRKRK